MQELVGRLDVLDPGASHSLKVIGYFDALVEGHASPEMLVRGAAFLSGATCGLVSERATLAVDATGGRAEPRGMDAAWPTHAVPGGGTVWIDRAGDRHANDDMILERLAIGIGITLERTAPHAALGRAVETLIDHGASLDARREAAVRLRLHPGSRYCVVAVPAAGPIPAGHQATVVTAVGAVRALVFSAADAVPGPRAGVGLPSDPDGLDRSWATALTALRLTTESEPVIHADELGAVILLAEVPDAVRADDPDLRALQRLVDSTPRVLPALEALARAESLRSAAAATGIHHSTMQSRATELSDDLGFDVRTVAGRQRLSLALCLYRLATTRFV